MEIVPVDRMEQVLDRALAPRCRPRSSRRRGKAKPAA
jgi:hypothetical protein